MLKHSTKGTIGVLSYDEQGNNIQITSNPITTSQLFKYNQRRMSTIKQASNNDGFHFEGQLTQKAYNIQCEMKGQSYTEVSKYHNNLQNLLWKELQCHPQFPQSISFVFLKQIINQPATPREHTFSQTFQSRLQPNKMYDLTNRADLNEFYKAFIYAGKEIDSQFIQKLYYLHNNGMTLNNSILLILGDLAKHGLYS